MKKIKLTTSCKKLLADVFTPVGIYLRLRDRFRDTILLESSNYNSAENSYSFIGINAIAGIEIRNPNELEIKYPNMEPQKLAIDGSTKIGNELRDFMQTFQVVQPAPMPMSMAQGLFGYTSYDAVQFFEDIQIKGIDKNETTIGNIHSPLQNKSGSLNHFSDHSIRIPLIRYRLYQYIIAVNHFKSELFICENKLEGIEGDADLIESIIRSKDIPAYPFSIEGIQVPHLDNECFRATLKEGIENSALAEMSQKILSRGYSQSFIGDEFNVYRALRNINPGQYLFYFDYGDNRLFGSGKGIHIESKEERKIPENSNPFHLLAVTLSCNKFIGSPTQKTIQRIDESENDNHGCFGGSIGFVGFDGSINHAVMVRAFLSKDSQLSYRAGGSVTISSDADKELQIVTNELNMLTQAIELAGEVN